MTDVILVLILSGIAIALIFIGVIYTYTSLACYAGIDISKNRYLLGPNPGQFLNAGINIINVTTEGTNLTDCQSKCQDPTKPDCDATCQARATECNSKCATKFAAGIEYVSYEFKIQYFGTPESKVSIIGKENQTATGAINQVISESTPSKLNAGDFYTFSKTFVKTTSCEADLNVTFTATDAATGVPSRHWSNHTTFCISPPAKDINVSVLSLAYVGNSVQTNVSVTGSDVYNLCPRAAGQFWIRANGTNDFTAELVNSSGQICAFDIDTNATRADNNQWLSDSYNLRTKFIVMNDIGTPITGDELVSVRIDFSGFYGDPIALPPNCNLLNVTKADGVTPLHQNITYSETSGGHCSKADIWFDWGYKYLDLVDGSWENGKPKIFYVYSTNDTTVTVNNEDLTAYYPTFTFIDFGALGNVSFNTTPASANVTLEGSKCPGP